MSELYFSGLNYTLANEDSSYEMSLLKPSMDHIVAVAGSGARVLPLFSCAPRRMTIVDISPEQLLLTELRIESCRALSLEEFLIFWGYPPVPDHPRQRRELFSKIQLSADCKRFFISIFEKQRWKSILYTGKWERTFKKISTICRAVLGDTIDELFEINDFREHLLFMENSFPWWKWNFLVFAMGNSTFFNTLLYKGSFPVKNVEESHFEYYRSAYKRIYSHFLPRNNYFLQMTLLGEIRFASGVPVECRPQVYDSVQSAIQTTQIQYLRGHILDIVSQSSNHPADFVSLSDVPSYFDDQTAHGFLERISAGLSPDALVAARFYLRVINSLKCDGFVDVTDQHSGAFASEMTQMYRMALYRKSAA